MANRGAFKITDKIIKQVEQLAAQGLSEEQIGSVIGCSRSTILRRKKDVEAFDAAIKNGKAKGIAKVSNALFQKANSGDNTAMIFFLKCRGGEVWRDNPNVKINMDSNAPAHVMAEQIMKAAANGEIPTSGANNLMSGLASMMKIEEVTELRERLEAIEAKILG